MALFAKKLKTSRLRPGLESIVEGLRVNLAATAANRAMTKMVISNESMNDAQAQELLSVTGQLEATIQRVARENDVQDLTPAQVEAAQAAGVLAADPAAAMSAEIKVPSSDDRNGVIGAESISDGSLKRTVAYEAYDESSNGNAVTYSVAYNMTASRQDPFGEALFPTVTITPDAVGYGVSIRLIQVFEDFKRSISGDLDRYNKKNVIRAIADPSILKNETTRAVPVARTESAKWFVSSTDVPVYNLDLEGESIPTAPLRFGAPKFSLIALSQTDALLANGVMDASDSIDPGGLALRAVYAKVGNNVLKFLTKDLPTSTFVQAPQGLHRLMNLNFTTDSLLINKDSRRADGTALSGALAAAVTGDYIVRLSANVTGSVNVETGDTQMMTSSVSVAQIRNAEGEILDHTVAGPAKDLADAIEAGAMIGYDLQAYRANQNRRQRGQLLDVGYYTQHYTVPFRSPITALKPANTDAAGEAGDLAALIVTTQIRTSNAAVAKLLEAANILKAYVDNRENSATPEILGVTRFLVKAAYDSASIDMTTAVDSTKSHERAADVQAVLVNKIRDMAFRLHRDSEYQAAANALAGGVAKNPTVIIATDPVLARYIQIDGELRTAGPNFDYLIVSTLDERMRGRIAVTFGDFTNTGEPNPMHFGNMAWRPELTVVLPIARGGSISKELTVQPSFLHVVNLPVLGFIEVTGLEEVIAAKVPMYTEIQ